MPKNPKFKIFEKKVGNETSYVAGIPGYPNNFTRDVLISAFLANNMDMLSSQIDISYSYQSEKENQYDGAEVGKIHHEFPGIMLRQNLITTYNACDTTALFLMAIERLLLDDRQLSDEKLSSLKTSTKKCVDYIKNHLKDSIFWEFPPSDATEFALLTTYWKDSILPLTSENGEPDYPIAYGLAHFINARGILAASKILDNVELKNLADEMFKKGIKKFITEKSYRIFEDKSGFLKQPSSDELHSLAYIPLDYKELLPIEYMLSRSKSLTTEAGIACNPKDIGEKLHDKYHGYVVWIFEQALINYGCRKFGIDGIDEITRRCIPYIGEGTELIGIIPEITLLGNKQQLWSVAAQVFFSNNYYYQSLTWL